MASDVASSAVNAAIAQISAGLDALHAAGLEPADRADATAIIRVVETVGRRIDAVQVQVVDDLDRSRWYRSDGHHSAKVMVRHVARLSDAEATRRTQIMTALREMPIVADHYRRGLIGTCQAALIGRTYANERVRARLIERDAAVARSAAHRSYRRFADAVHDWVTLADEDGTADTNERNHHNRDAKLVQDFDKAWELTAGCGALDGAVMYDIFKAFIDAEFNADWDKAKAAWGDAAREHLDRTDNQRRFDALKAIFLKAAATRAAEPGGSRIDTNVVIDADTFERFAAKFFGAEPQPPTLDFDPDLPDIGLETSADDSELTDAPTHDGGVRFRCNTIDGHHLDPTEVVAHALLDHVRRVVLGTDSVTIDMGRRSRLFTGPAQLAVKLQSPWCAWPGCHTPVTSCQSDHLTEWSDSGGRTDPGNGAPLCGRHNRLKHQHGYTAHRDERGRLHVYRPDGTEID